MTEEPKKNHWYEMYKLECLKTKELEKQIVQLKCDKNYLTVKCLEVECAKGSLREQIEKLKQDLDSARENANKQEQWEIYSVLNDIYNDNFEVITSVSN